METGENHEQRISGLKTTVEKQCDEENIESHLKEDDIPTVKILSAVDENTEDTTFESVHIEKTADEGQVVNVEDPTTIGDGKNVVLTNNTKIEAIEGGESETGEQIAEEDQEAVKEEETPNKEESESSEDTSNEEGSESGQEIVSEAEDESVEQIINQENRADMNKSLYLRRDKYQALNSVGLTTVEKSSGEMIPIEARSGEINNECGNKERCVTVPSKCQESQSNREAEKKKRGKTTSFNICFVI